MLLSAGDLQILRRLDEGMTQAQAGYDLGIDQPAVSKALRAAEVRLGMALVQSDGRRSRLTSAGRELARAGADALRQLYGLDDVVASLRAGAGRVRVVASSTPGAYVLPQVVARFLQLNPQAHVEIDVVAMPLLWETFVGGGHDFALAPRMALAGDIPSEPLYVDPIVLFAAPSHPFAGRPAVSLDDLRAETLVGKFTEAYWGQLNYDLLRRGYAWAKQIDLRSAEAVKRIVASGTGIGMLFESSVRLELERGELSRLPIVDPMLEQTYCLASRPGAAPPPIAQEFARFLREQLRAC